MLDIKTAQLVKNAIDKHFGGKEFIDLENVCRMQSVPVNTKDGGYTILSTQYGDLTILVWIQVDATLGVCVRSVKTQSW